MNLEPSGLLSAAAAVPASPCFSARLQAAAWSSTHGRVAADNPITCTPGGRYADLAIVIPAKVSDPFPAHSMRSY